MINNKTVIEQVDKVLRRMLELGHSDVNVFFVNNLESSETSHIQSLEVEISEKKEQIDNLIRRQSTSPEIVQEMYASQIADAAQHLKSLHQELEQLRHTLESESVLAERQSAYDEIAAEGLEHFWQHESRHINQILHRLMGRYRFRVLNGKIIDIVWGSGV